MAISGLGVDSYYRVQLESSYGTAVTNSMISIPAYTDSSFKAVHSNIENSNLISSRLLQSPNSGRVKCTGEIKMDMHPTLIGSFFRKFLGASSNSGSGAITHTWLCPISGTRNSSSFTLQQAKGRDTAEQYAGCVVTGISIEVDTEKNATITFRVVAKSYSEGVARVSSFSYPTQIPYNWSFLNAYLTPVGGSEISLAINSLNLDLDLNYNTEDFKSGSLYIAQPQFNGIPTATLTANIDADKQFLTYARAHTECSIDIAFTSIQNVSGTTKFSTNIELPGCRLNPETEIPNSNELLKMDLEFNCGYGGSTTGSGANDVMFEIRHVDATASYPATA